MPAALSAALTKLLGSCSAEIHQTHTTANNDVFILVHASSSGLQLHFTFSMSSSCHATVDDLAGHVFQQHGGSSRSTVLYRHWSLASQHPWCKTLFSLNFQQDPATKL
jgi:hypothetical protein